MLHIFLMKTNKNNFNILRHHNFVIIRNVLKLLKMCFINLKDNIQQILAPLVFYLLSYVCSTLLCSLYPYQHNFMEIIEQKLNHIPKAEKSNAIKNKTSWLNLNFNAEILFRHGFFFSKNVFFSVTVILFFYNNLFLEIYFNSKTISILLNWNEFYFFLTLH